MESMEGGKVGGVLIVFWVGFCLFVYSLLVE